MRVLVKSASGDQGFTLMEAMVTCAIIGILAAVSASLITNMFDSQIRVGQMLDQQSTIETYYGFMASRLATTQRGKIGLAVDGAIEPLSIAGDQLVFESQGFCYRVFWLSDEVPDRDPALESQIRFAVASNCSDEAIVPKRGPNEPLPDGVDSNGDGFAEPEDEAYFDLAIDSLAPNWPAVCEAYNDAHEGTDYLCEKPYAVPLANGIVKERPPNAPGDGYPNPLVPFKYINDNTQPVAGIWDTAGVGEPSSFYDDAENAELLIAAIDATVYIEAMPGFEGAKVRDRHYQQTFSLQQVCSIPGLGPAAAPVEAGGDLTGLYPDPEIKPQAVTRNKLADAAVGPDQLGVMPAARVVRSSDQNIPEKTWTPIQFSSAEFETVDMWNSGQSTRLVAPRDGIYQLTGTVQWTLGSFLGYRSIGFRKNGSTMLDRADIQPSGVAGQVLGSPTTSNLSSVVRLNAGDYIQLVVEQDQTSNADQDLAAVATEYAPAMTMTWIGNRG